MRLLLIFSLLFLSGCAWFGAAIDDVCIAGRLSQEQANHLNQSEWQKRHADYLAPVKAGDRVLNANCSELVKAVAEKVQ